MMREWFAYRLQNEAQTLLHSRKLFEQFIVEAYTMVESERLSYIRNNKKNLELTSIAVYKHHWMLEAVKTLLKEKE